MSHDIPPPIGQKLVALRKAKELTQQDLADKSGIARSTIAAYEGDVIRPTMTNLCVLAGALDVSPTEIGSPYDPEGPRAHKKVRFKQAAATADGPGAQQQSEDAPDLALQRMLIEDLMNPGIYKLVAVFKTLPVSLQDEVIDFAMDKDKAYRRTHRARARAKNR